MIEFDYNGRFWDLWNRIQLANIEDDIVIDMNGHRADCGFATLALHLAKRNINVYLKNVGDLCKRVKEYLNKHSNLKLTGASGNELLD